ncbi:MAG TPA: amidohydrolase family protein [Pyrinomonadaceae bacterium]|nr:amidohydrolase family protein [Pyrinomonadaceae bacterium]
MLINPVLYRAYKFTNGKWFNGQQFVGKTFYCVNGILTKKKPAKIDETIDLKGGFVVPPFADAHCHHFDAPYNVKQQVEMYLRDGVFYAKVLANSRTGALKVADMMNKPASIDVSYAHGSLTHSFGHGFEIYETLALRLIPTTDVMEANKEKIAASRLRENDAYYLIDTAEDLEQKWQKILDGKPDFIKINLVTSENFEQQRENIPNIKLGHIGLDPRLVPLIVQKAHRAGLRVSVHIETAADYRTALAAGVDEMAHVPGYYFGLEEKPESYLLTDQDAKETARRKIWVVPTPNLPSSFNDPMILNRVETVAKHNLQLLKRRGVRIAFGSDAYMSTPVEYVLYIARLGIFSNLEMLKIWTEDTPQTIFPNRKIGRLREGYEASFLVLSDNPIDNLERIKNIKMRFKQGYLINIK